MGDVLFENVYTDNEQALCEYHYKFRMRGAIINGCLMLLLAILDVVAWQRTYNWVYVLLFFVMTILGIRYFMLPYLRAKKIVRDVLKRNHGKIPQTYIRFGERINVRYREDSIVIQYDELQRVYFFRYCIVLKGTEWIVTLSPDGFQKGTLEEFKQFLREKRPDLKIPE